MTQPPPYGDSGNPWQTPPNSPLPQSAPPQSAPPQSAPPATVPPPEYAPPDWTPPGWSTPASAPPGYPPPVFGPPTAPGGFPPYFPPPKKRRWLLVTSIVVVLVVLLGGGGVTAAYFLTRNQDGIGQNTPQAAVENFLQAVYVDQNPTKAAPLVCKAARDPKKLAAKINEIKRQDDQYDSPRYTWDSPTTLHGTTKQATLSARIILTTGDVQSSSQTLTFTVIRSTGWFVCDVSTT